MSEEAKRCCCGRYTTLTKAEPAHLHNETLHEMLGPKENFCGPLINHELRDLHASLAALKAENEALKKERKQIIDSEIDCGARSVAKDDEIEGLRQELRRYTSWQPSDPGTKEAMEWAAFLENMFRCHPERRPTKDEANLVVIAHSHRAAMVRLEEAENAALHTHSSDGLEPVCVSIECLHDLAVARKDRDEYYQNWQASRQYEKARLQGLEAAESESQRLAGELVELRKRMGEAEKALGRAVTYLKDFDGKIVTDMFITDRSYIVNNYDAEQDLGNVLAILASPPSPAPVEKMPMAVKVSPKACVKCGCGTSAHWADNDGPFQGAYCHSCCQCADYVPPAPVESKPKEVA